MKKRKDMRKGPEVVWQKEERTLTLEGEPVLEYVLAWPEIRDGGLGGRWINKYYARLIGNWRLRWQQEVYWAACLELAARRAASRPFTPWRCMLEGEVTFQEGDLLSLRMEGTEVREEGRPLQVRWGDVWKVREGAPCQLKEFFPGERGWKKRLTTQIREQGQARKGAGDCFLDRDWEERVKKLLPVWDFCLTPEGLEFAFPHCSIAPAVEGAPVFCIPCPDRTGREEMRDGKT